MLAHVRRSKITALLARLGRIEVAALQRSLGVSPATLRRDLAELEAAGSVLRVHGGVVHPSAARGEPTLREKQDTAHAAKRAIAAAAAAAVPDGATLFIDSGTTCFQAGRLLLSRPSLRIITNSIPLLAHAVEHGCAARLHAIGGELRGISGALVSPLATGAVARWRAGLALVGASGLDVLEGASTTEPDEAAVKRLFLERASESWLLADASKWEHASNVAFGPWRAFRRWFTDSSLPPAAVRKISIPVQRITP